MVCYLNFQVQALNKVAIYAEGRALNIMNASTYYDSGLPNKPLSQKENFLKATLAFSMSNMVIQVVQFSNRGYKIQIHVRVVTVEELFAYIFGIYIKFGYRIQQC